MQEDRRERESEEQREIKRLEKMARKSEITEKLAHVAEIAVDVAITTAVGILVTKAMDKGGSGNTFDNDSIKF